MSIEKTFRLPIMTEKAKRLVLAKSIRFVPFGKAWRVTGRGVDLLIAGDSSLPLSERDLVPIY